MADSINNSELSETAETLYILDAFVLCSIGITISVIFLFLFAASLRKLKQSQEDQNKYYQYAINAAIISISFKVFEMLIRMLFGNTLLISYEDFTFVSITDSISATCIAVSKVFVYYTFTFHFQSVFRNKDNMALFLKIWMVIVGIVTVSICIMDIIDDSWQDSPKEIGVAPTHNFKIAMLLGHDDAKMHKLVMMIIGIMHLVYTAVLLYLYIKALKQV